MARSSLRRRVRMISLQAEGSFSCFTGIVSSGRSACPETTETIKLRQGNPPETLLPYIPGTQGRENEKSLTRLHHSNTVKQEVPMEDLFENSTIQHDGTLSASSHREGMHPM